MTAFDISALGSNRARPTWRRSLSSPLLIPLELVVRRTRSAPRARAGLTLVLLHSADFESAYFNELRVASPTECPGGLVPSDGGHLAPAHGEPDVTVTAGQRRLIGRQVAVKMLVFG